MSASADRTAIGNAAGPTLAGKFVGILPGLGLTAGIAAASFALRAIPGVSTLSPMILAILIGIGLHNMFGTPAIAIPGVKFSLRRVLRFAIILLGLQLTAMQVVEVGPVGVGIIVVALVSTFVFTKWFGRVLGVERKLAELIAAGTSICGASAVIATNTVTDAPDEDVAYAVACVTVFGSIAMFSYPVLGVAFGLAPHAFGLWAGSSIHEIAQVVAAAYQGGQQAGDFGTIAKLSRVMLLAPLVLSLGFIAQRGAGGAEGTGSAKVPLPWFVLGFIALVAFNSVVAIPTEVKAPVATATTFMLSMALAAMGLETSIAKVYAKGLRPMLLGLAAFVFISGFSLILIRTFT
ncbi:MAG TPA: YeiH family protein [Devosiaceae bacterium]